MEWWWIWVAVIVIAVVLEIITVDFISIWFAFGALVALILSFFPTEFWLQALVCVSVSFVLLIFLRKICLKLLKGKEVATNADSLVGKTLKVLTAITEDEYGSAKWGDVVWTIKGKDGFTANVGEYVTVVEISGNKLIVEKGEKE